MLVLLVALGCNNAEITQPTGCSRTWLDDDSWFGTSLAAEQERFHGALSADDMDWNVSNALGAAVEHITFDPVAFQGDSADVCEFTDTGDLLQLSAPVDVEYAGTAWIPGGTADGVLQMDATGHVYLLVEFAVPVADELRAAAASLIEAEMGVTVPEGEVPAEAWVSTSTAGPEAGFAATLSFTPDQTVVFVDASDPEPMGAEVRLAETNH